MAVFVFSGIFFVKVLILFGGLHKAAIALLAVGLAVQAARLTANHVARLWPIFSRGTFWMVCLTTAFTTLCLTKQHVDGALSSELPTGQSDGRQRALHQSRHHPARKPVAVRLPAARPHPTWNAGPGRASCSSRPSPYCAVDFTDAR